METPFEDTGFADHILALMGPCNPTCYLKPNCGCNPSYQVDWAEQINNPMD